ncbi:hypothetical protein HTVC104P_gp34 [Pelagibacter phage HTVC104P]|jgi:hypothetical protein|nr:hypothetical protein HTVC104P_gp34 [Pelagibacter phage HTVC104P]|tara:strand:- start:334 stop:714 length:381 start_codon:yes stop_codon:yes gene_type:complete
MVLNKDTPVGINSGQGEGSAITSEVLLYRCVIVRAIMDALDVDIHAWGNARDNIIKDAIDWFSMKDYHFCLVCDYANLDPSFIIKKYTQLRDANAKKLFRGKNLNKFLTHYICSFHEDPSTKHYYG